MKSLTKWIYLTDNRYLAEGIIEKFQMKRDFKIPFPCQSEESLHERIEFILVAFDEKAFRYNYIESAENMRYLEKSVDEKNVFFINAFEPTEDGRHRFMQLQKALGLSKMKIRQMELDYFKPGKRHAYEETSDHASLRELSDWAEERMNKAYSVSFEEAGLGIQYDLCLFSLFSLLEEKRRDVCSRHEREGYTVFEKNGTRYYGQECGQTEDDTESAVVVSVKSKTRDIPPPAEYTIIEILEDADAKGVSPAETMDVLFELYQEGIISYPITHVNSISDKLLKRRMSVTELFFGEYLYAASEAEFRQYPAYLKQNYQESGIILLNVREFEDYYNSIPGRNKKTILDLLIRRSLAVMQESCSEETTEAVISWAGKLYKTVYQKNTKAGWKQVYEKKKVTAELEPGESITPAGMCYFASEDNGLYTVQELLRVRRLYCGSDSRMEVKAMRALLRSRYTDRIGKYVFLRKSERLILSAVPDNLLELSEIVLLHDQLRKIKNGMMSKEDFRRWVIDRINENTEKINAAAIAWRNNKHED